MDYSLLKDDMLPLIQAFKAASNSVFSLSYLAIAPNFTKSCHEPKKRVKRQLASTDGTYIPLEGCIVHRYWVNRG